MSWQGILGHDALVERFRRSLEQKRLATTFLFVGPDGIGKRTFALKLAQSILCSRVPEEDLAPCGACAACQQVLSDSHPDLAIVRKPVDRAFIPVEMFIGDREHRMRTGLCHFMSLTPSGGKRRIAIIDDGDWLNQEGANSLLKTLEEPSPGAVIILISTSVQRQLPTIRSRSQVIRFAPLSQVDLATCLVEQGYAESNEQAMTMASRAGGSLAQAIALSSDEITEYRRELWHSLAKTTIDRFGLAKAVNEFVDSAGKDTAAKRKHLRLTFDAAIEFYAAIGRQLCGAPKSQDQELAGCVANVVERESLSSEATASLVERCIDAVRQVSSNANMPMLVDAWLSDLATVTRTGIPLLVDV